MPPKPFPPIVRSRSGAFVAGFILGALTVSLLFAGRSSRERDDLRLRAVAAHRDLDQARSAQRIAQERAGKLQAELTDLVGYAQSIEDGSRTSESRAGNIADHIDQACLDSGELQKDLARAGESLETSGIFLTELGSILQGIQARGGDSPLPP